MKKLCIYILIILYAIYNTSAQKKVIETSGDVLQVVIPVSAILSTVMFDDDQRSTWQAVKTIGITSVVTHILKQAVNKERPNGGHFSFPSGHTSSAFSGAAFLQKHYGWDVGTPAYLLAGYVGWSRVNSNNHDYWDVIGGAIIAIYTAHIFTKPLDKKPIKFTFSKSRNNYLVGFSYSF